MVASRALGRRDFLRRVGGVAVVGLTVLAGCKQPVAPAEATRAVAKAQGTPAPGRELRLAILHPGHVRGYPFDRLDGSLRVAGYGASKNLSDPNRNRLMQLWRTPEQFAPMLEEMVREGVDVIIAPSTATTLLAHIATKTTPIVTISPHDLSSIGLVVNPARPGGNVTGLTTHDPLRGAKMLDLLAQLDPSASRVAVVWNPDEPDRDAHAAELEVAAQARGVHCDLLPVRNADEAVGATQKLTRQQVDVVVSLGDPVISAHQSLIDSLARVHKLPVLFERKELVRAGGLMSFGPDVGRLWRRAGEYVAHIARGGNPAEIAVAHDTSVEYTFNLATAQALGLSIPPSLLSKASEVVR